MLRAALFAGTAGYVDAICYLLLGHAFAANMTGNLVEVGMRAAQGEWGRAGWLGTVMGSFLLGVLAARFAINARGSSRLLLLIEAGLMAAAATEMLDGTAVPVLAAAMAIQNQAALHAGFRINVGFVTGDIQLLGQHIVAASSGTSEKPEGGPPTIMAVLAFYAVGAALGTIATRAGAGLLWVPAAAIAATGLLPGRLTGLQKRD